MSVSRIAAGAEVVELVHEPLGAGARHHGAHRDPAPRCSGETVGPSRPGVSATAASTCAPRDVVVHHHVAARDQDALEPAPEDLEAVGLGAGAGDEHRLRVEDRLAEGLQPGGAQRAAGLDDVGDHVGDAELDAGLHRAVEAGHGGVDAVRIRYPRTTPTYDVAMRSALRGPRATE